MTDDVHVSPYDPSWLAQFEALKARVWPWVANHASAIEHVGSTSVRGLAAKPIIDLDIIVADEVRVAACIAALGENGYVHVGERGIVGRHAFDGGDGPDHNLYVCLDGSLGLRNHLGLRDFLREHPDRAKVYGALKLELAKRHPHDIAAYTTGKTDFLVGLLQELGLGEDELAEVEASNQD